MVTRAENDLLTQTGPGTPGGAFMRCYWHPLALSSELPLVDAAPLPVRLLGEDLVLFRDDQGRPGLLGLKCPHRCADLSYGRVEDGGLRCLYHGWLFDVTGACTEMPAEAPGTAERVKLKHTAYPCVEKSGIIFTYMGAGEPPLFPAYEFLDQPEDHRVVTKAYLDCNYLQGLEGEVDPAHLSYLHRPLKPKDTRAVPGSTKSADTYYRESVAPKLDVERTDYGVRNYSIRDAGDGTSYVRITNFIMPDLAAIVGNEGRIGEGYNVHWHTPIDDTHHLRIDLVFNRVKPLDKTRHEKAEKTDLVNFRYVRSAANRYLQDRQMMKTVNFTGMGEYFAAQDAFAIESQGPIHDRTQEHLMGSDTCVTAMRRAILKGIEDVQAGRDPIHVVRDPKNNDMTHLQVKSQVIPNTVDYKSLWKKVGAAAQAFVAAALLATAAHTPAKAQDWKAEWDKTVADAKKEGALTLSVPSGNLWRTQLMAFAKEYPDIKVEMTPFASRDYWPRVVKEREAGQYLWDLRVGGADTLAYRLRDQGQMADIRALFVLPEVKDESKWMGGFDRIFLDKEKKYFPAFVAYVSQTAQYNAKFIKDPPPTVADLVNNGEWKGKMSMADPRGGSSLNSLSVMTKVMGEDSVKKLMVDQEMVISSDPRQLLNWLVSGRYPISFGIPTATITEYANRGGSADDFKDVPGLMQWAPGVGALQMTTKQPHPAATKLFVNWILTKDVQTKLMEGVKLNSLRTDVPVVVPEIAIEPGHFDEYNGTQDEAIEPYAQKTQALLKTIAK